MFRWIPLIPVQLFFFFLTFPFFLLIYISLLRWRVSRGPWYEAPFGGLFNFKRILGNPEFYEAFGRTLVFVAIAVPLEFLLGFIIAYLVTRDSSLKRFLTTMFLVPMMIIPVVVGYNFSMIFIQDGPFNQALSWIVGTKVHIAWLSVPWSAMAAIIIGDIWQWTPLMFLMMVAGLSALPKALIDAGRVLGASSWQIFWRIKVPLLKPIFLIAIILRAMEAFKVFDLPMLLTRGGPVNATQTIAVYLYELGWDYANISKAASSSVVILLFALTIIILAIRVLKRAAMEAERELGI